jgi:hypothetical protein
LRAEAKALFASYRAGAPRLPGDARPLVDLVSAVAKYTEALAGLGAAAKAIAQDSCGHRDLLEIEAQQIPCLLSAAQCELTLAAGCASVAKSRRVAAGLSVVDALPSSLPADLAARNELLKSCVRRCTESLRLEVKAAKRAQFMHIRNALAAAAAQPGASDDARPADGVESDGEESYVSRCARAGAAQMLGVTQRYRLAAIFATLDEDSDGRVAADALSPPLPAGEAAALLEPLASAGAVASASSLTLADFEMLVNARAGNDAARGAASGSKRGPIGPAEARVAFWEDAVPTGAVPLVASDAGVAGAAAAGADMRPATLETLASVSGSKAFYRRGRAYALLGRFGEAKREVALAAECHVRGSPGGVADPVFQQELARIARRERSAAARERRVYRNMARNGLRVDDSSQSADAADAAPCAGCTGDRCVDVRRAARSFAGAWRVFTSELCAAVREPSTPAAKGAAVTVEATTKEGRARAHTVGIVLSRGLRTVSFAFVAMLLRIVFVLCCGCFLGAPAVKAD